MGFPNPLSYVTIDDADTYFTSQLNSDWGSYTPDQKQAALYQATAAIDNLLFSGVTTSYYNHRVHGQTLVEQDFEFPRNGCTVIPDGILAACCECAVAFADGVDIEQEIRRRRVQSQGFASVRQSYQQNLGTEPYLLAGIPSYKAWMLLLPFLGDPRAIRIKRIS